MKSKLSLLLVCIVLASGCGRYERAEEPVTMPAPVVVARDQEEDGREQNTNKVVDKEIHIVTDPIVTQPQRTPIKVKGIYISAYVAGTQNLMDEIIQHIDETEINAVVIDVKDDNGRITFSMDSPVVSEIGAVKRFIPDIEGLMKKLKEHNIYTIARVVAFRDPYLPEYKPELALKLPDGSIYRDSKGLAWVNPYKQEVWDYLVEVGIEASKAGFDEVLPDGFDIVALSKNGSEQYMGNMLTLTMPLDLNEFLQTIGILALSQSGFTRRSESENDYISKAKEALMSVKGMNEAQAHKYLQRVSMNSGKKLLQTAMDILDELD